MCDGTSASAGASFSVGTRVLDKRMGAGLNTCRPQRKEPERRRTGPHPDPLHRCAMEREKELSPPPPSLLPARLHLFHPPLQAELGEGRGEVRVRCSGSNLFARY